MSKKVLFVNYGKDLRDKTAWSGTPYSVLKALEKSYTVIPYTMNGLAVFFAKAFSKIASIISRKLYLYDHSLRLAQYAAKQIQKKVRSCDCDYVFVIGGMLAAYLKVDCPIIVLGDAVFASMVDYYWFNLSDKTIREGNVIQQRLFDNSDKIILTSQWAIKEATENYLVKKEKLALVHFGPNIDEKDIKKEEHDAIYLLFIGVDWERKGGAIAVECVDRLNKIDNSHKYYLNIVGCSPEYEVASEYVKFWGFLNNNKKEDVEKLNKIRSKSDLFILPTRAECSAIVFCEAAAFSLPVVTFDTGGNRDYVIEGYNGVCLPLTTNADGFVEVILDIVNDEKKFVTMKENAYQLWRSQLNWDVFGSKVREIIDKL